MTQTIVPTLLRRVGGAVSRMGGRLAERWFQWRFGPETGGYWFLDEHGLPSEDRVWYVPTEWLGLRRAFRRLRPGPGDVLLDVGAGRGRAVLVAAMSPFRKVIGVELAEEMTTVARLAVEKNRRRLTCPDVELVTSDALTYEIPRDVTVVYMYCPFVGEVFSRFLARLLEFADASPHRVRLVYNYPMEHSTLLETRRFQVIDVCSASWPPRSLGRPEVMVTYEVLRSSESAGSSSTGRAGADSVAIAENGRCWLESYDPGFVVWRHGRVWLSSRNWRHS